MVRQRSPASAASVVKSLLWDCFENMLLDVKHMWLLSESVEHVRARRTGNLSNYTRDAIHLSQSECTAGENPK